MAKKKITEWKKFKWLAEDWLKIHYPDKKEPIDIRYSAVINFAIYLDKLRGVTKT